MKTNINLPIILAAMGTLKEGFSNNRVIKGAIYLGPGYTQPKYSMKSLGGFPSLFDGDEEVAIDLYEISPAQLDRVDSLEGYNRFDTTRSFFNRELEEVYLDNGTPLLAWIYEVQNKDSISSNHTITTRDKNGRLSWL